MFDTWLATVGLVGGASLTPVAWGSALLCAVLVVALNGARVKWSFFLPWLPWALFLVISSLLAPQGSARLRAVLMLEPLVVGLAASAFTVHGEDLQSLYNMLRVTLCGFMVIFLARYVFGPEEGRYMFAPQAITAVLFACMFAARYVTLSEKGSLLLYALVGLVPVLTTARATTLVAGLLYPLSLAPVSTRRRVLITGAVVLVGIGVFYSSTFQEKMFLSGSGSVGDLTSDVGDLQTSGRAEMWLALWEEFPERPWLGHGADASGVVSMEVANMDQPHNDYLRLLYDYGVIGLALFLLAVIWTMVRLMRLKSVAVEHRWWKYALASSFIPYLLLMITDNIILYAAFFGNLQLVLIGCLLASTREQSGVPARVTVAEQEGAPGAPQGYVTS